MKINKSIIITSEILIILIYSSLILFSLTIQPITLILGIICVLFIPGYNLIAILKPKFNLIQKIGYMTIFSLAVGNLLMLFDYIFFYDITIGNSDKPFFFNPISIIISIQIINLILIIIKYRTSVKNKKYYNFIIFKSNRNSNDIRKITIVKYFFVYLFFIISLILMSISTLYSQIPNDNSFSVNQVDYRKIFTFFNRVPPIFYIFLIMSILCLAFIIFNTKNHFIILACISLFLYILWILPYLQINNYFSSDPYTLSIYLKYFGVKPFKENSNSFTLSSGKDYLIQRYATSFFTSTLLIFATGTNIDFVLWYIFPLSYIFISFFIYATFQKFKSKKETNNLDLKILTILAVLTPQFIKMARSASTGVIGIYIFFILIVEFYICFKRRNFNLNLKDFFLFILLFLFLSLTHTEECIYFIILISLFGIYSLFFHFINKKSDIRFNKFGILFCILLLIFYITQEFFSWFTIYMNFLIPEPQFSFLYDIYYHTKVLVIPSLQGTFTISYLIIGIIIFGTITIYYFVYFVFTHYFKLILNIFKFIMNKFRKLFNKIKQIISMKFLQFLMFPFVYIIVFLLYLIFFQDQIPNISYFILDVILSFTYLVFHIIIFFRGTLYYKIENRKQNYFLISLIPPSLFIIFLFLTEDFTLAFYILNVRLVSYFIFFNLIILQNSYFKHFMIKNRKFLTFVVVLSFLFASYYSLRLVGFG